MDPDVQQVPVSATTTTGAPTSPEVITIDDDPPSSQTQPQQSPPMQPVKTPPCDVPLEQLEKALENACETLHTLSTGVIDFSFDTQHVLFSKVNEFVRDLRAIDECSKKVNATIPASVIEAIDKGRNPEWCTYDTLEGCAEASNTVRGKLDAVQHFKDELEKAYEEAKRDGLYQVKEEEVTKLINASNPISDPINGPQPDNPSNTF